MATEDPLRNALISICLEQLTAIRRPGLWKYTEDGVGLLLTKHVKLQNNLAFGNIMALYRAFASKLETG